MSTAGPGNGPGHRGGLEPDAPGLPAIGRVRHDAGCLDGVLTHAGGSSFAYTAGKRRLAADNERDSAVAAGRLRRSGLPVNVVSVRSTPTPTPPKTPPASPNCAPVTTSSSAS